MKLPRFSVLNLLLIVTLIGLSVSTILQNRAMDQLRKDNARMREEIGIIGPIAQDSIAVRPLFNIGAQQTWRFRISKPNSTYDFCFGIVDVDEQGELILPAGYQRGYQVVPCKSQGETEIVLAVDRTKTGRFVCRFQEFEGDIEKTATSTRIDAVDLEAMTNAAQMTMIENIHNSLGSGLPIDTRNAEVTLYAHDKVIELVRSELPNQPGPRRAFILALRPALKH